MLRTIADKLFLPAKPFEQVGDMRILTTKTVVTLLATHPELQVIK